MRVKERMCLLTCIDSRESESKSERKQIHANLWDLGLELAHYFCCILLAKENHKTSLD